MQKTKAIKGHQTLTMIVVYHISICWFIIIIIRSKKGWYQICINSIHHVKISRIYTEYVHVHVCIYIYVCVCMYMYMYMCMYMNMYMYMKYMYMYMYMYMIYDIYMCACVCICICICIWATVNIWYIAPSHHFLKSVLSFFRFWYISKCYRF